MIKPLFLYASVVWTSCSNQNLMKLLKLQKRAARVILNVHPRHPSIPLFNELRWLPFYKEADVRRCCYAFNRTKGSTPSYLDELLVLNGDDILEIPEMTNVLLSHLNTTVLLKVGEHFLLLV